MDCTIRPYIGTGDIKFGMTPEAVRSHFDTERRSFKRTPESSFPCDFFPSQGMFFYYESSRTLEAIEFCSPASPTIFGLNLFSFTLEQAVFELAALDPRLERENGSVISYVLGVSIYSSLAGDGEDGSLESVLAFREGYYDA